MDTLAAPASSPLPLPSSSPGYCPTCRLPLSPSGHRQCACSTTTLLVMVVGERGRAQRSACRHGQDVARLKCGWCLAEATGLASSAALMLTPLPERESSEPDDDEREDDDLDREPPLFVRAPEAA